MSVTDPSRSEKKHYGRRSSHHMQEASWLNTSGKRRCSLKRCMHCTHGSHALESVSFSSLLSLPLATSLAPRHVPRTSPPHSPNATSTSQLHSSLQAQNPPPCPPLPPSPSPYITVRPRRRRKFSQKARRHAVNHAEQAHGQRPPQRRRVRRKEPRRGPMAASESIATHKKRATNSRHNARPYAPSVTLQQYKPLRTP